MLSAHTISLIDALTHKNRVKCFITDYSPYNRNRTKKLELSSKIYDHVSHSFLKGYHMLTLGWSDGASFIPIDFAMVATVKRIINHVREDIDKRSCGFRRRKDAIKEKPILVIEMLKNTYILLSWERRVNLDSKTLGLLFQMHCDDIKGVKYITAIQMLLQIIE